MTIQRVIIIASMFITTGLLSNSGSCDTLPSPIPLPQLVSLFMISPDEEPSWMMDVGELERRIEWSPIEVEEANQCGSYASCRRGVARVAIERKELKSQRAQPYAVEWGIFMASFLPSKFGPELIDFSPRCDTVSCEFEITKTLISGGFTLQQMCHAGPGSARTTVYLATRQGKHVYIAYHENEGSGGASNSLTLYLKKPISNESLCAEAKSME